MKSKSINKMTQGKLKCFRRNHTRGRFLMDEKNKQILEAAKEKATEMEIGAEIGDLREQLSAMESTLTQLKQVAMNTSRSGQVFEGQSQWMAQSQQATSQLKQQIQGFRSQTQQQLQQVQQQLQQSVQQAMSSLTQASQQIQSHHVLVQMSQLIDQTQQQLSQINQQNQQSYMSQMGQQNQQMMMEQESRQGSLTQH